MLWIPLAVSVLACTIAIRLPYGRDLAVLAFLVPWYGLRTEVGVGILPAQIVAIALALKYVACGRLSVKGLPGVGYLLALIVAGSVAALITFATLSAGSSYSGGAMRNGMLRFCVALISFLLSLFPVALAYGARSALDPVLVLRAYVAGVLMLSVIGLAQFAVWHATAWDPLPIGLFLADPDGVRSGMLQQGSFSFLRVSSLGGEPKSLGQSIVAALLILFTLRHKIMLKTRRLPIYVVLGAVLIMTASTSAFLTFLAGFLIVLAFRVVRKPLRQTTITWAITIFALIVMAVYFAQVSSQGLPHVIDPTASQSPSAVELLRQRTIERVEVEDSDFVILSSFIHDSAGIMLGRGFGLGHLLAEPFIPEQLAYYMKDTVIAPKSGVVLMLVAAGVPGLLLFSCMLGKLIPSAPAPARLRPTALDPERADPDYVSLLQALGISLACALLLRTYLLDATMLVLSLMPSLALQGSRIWSVGPVRPEGAKQP
jgi:hypothetical protein